MSDTISIPRPYEGYGWERAEPWMDEGLCAQTDPEAFFPEKGGSTAQAKKVCGSCDVREQCLAYAMAHDERYGIWGGLSERERRRLKRGEQVPPPPPPSSVASEAVSQTRRPWPVDGDERLRAMHAERMSDMAIGKVLVQSATSVGRHRGALGLAPNFSRNVRLL